MYGATNPRYRPTNGEKVDSFFELIATVAGRVVDGSDCSRWRWNPFEYELFISGGSFAPSVMENKGNICRQTCPSQNPR